MENNTLINEPLVVIPASSTNHTGTVIFLHGSGDSGANFCEWVRSLSKFLFPHIRVLFPTAPERAYTPNGGWPSRVWFDRTEITPDAGEHMATLDPTAKELVNIVKQEISLGIPMHRIAIGGFSMGGGMSLHLGYRYLPGLAGVFALSSFLSTTSAVFETLKEHKCEKPPPLFMAHGTADDMIVHKWGHETYSNITKFGVVGEFHELPNISHELDKRELNILKTWLLQKIPEES